MPDVAAVPSSVSLDARWLAMSEDERFRILCWTGVRDVYARQLTCITNLYSFRPERRTAIERVMRDERPASVGMTPTDIREAGIHPYAVEGYAG